MVLYNAANILELIASVEVLDVVADKSKGQAGKVQDQMSIIRWID